MNTAINKTAMQELIEDVKANMNGCYVALNEYGLSKGERMYYNSSIIVAKDVIKKATELLEKEKQHILDAYRKGWEDQRLGLLDHKNDYYNETYKQP